MASSSARARRCRRRSAAPAKPWPRYADDPRRPVAVAGDLPDGRAGDPAAVERERRHQVEHEQQHVHRDEEAEPQVERASGRRGALERRGVRRSRPSRAARRSADRRDDDDQRASPAARRPRPGTPGPGERVSLLIFITPPKKKRSMPLTSMPSRRAASAWPSSCSRIEPKKPKRGRDGGPERQLRVAEHVLERLVEPEDEQEQDEEPRDVDADADPEDRISGRDLLSRTSSRNVALRVNGGIALRR